VGNVAYREEMINACNILVRKPEGNSSLPISEYPDIDERMTLEWTLEK